MAGVAANKLFNAGAAGILALASLGTAFAESAADTNTALIARTVSTQEIKVPMRDARGVSPASIKRGAAMVSNDAQVFVFFGDNPEAFE